MNTKQFMVLFASVALLNIANGTFTGGEAAVVSGLGVYIPLLAGTAGTLSLPLAVLGVLKLAAAVKLAGGLTALNLKGQEPQYEEASSSYDSRRYRAQQYRGYRTKRSAEHNEAVFSLVSSMDMYSCGKALVCGLEAKDPQSLSQDEQIIMALFA